MRAGTVITVVLHRRNGRTTRRKRGRSKTGGKIGRVRRAMMRFCVKLAKTATVVINQPRAPPQSSMRRLLRDLRLRVSSRR